ncbi:MAG: DUF819 family protein [Cyclobacteriaceae bacterium]|nr:DUF819 family protein [Cyclobacteriaceae bacterium]
MEIQETQVLVTNDAVVLGILMVMLALIFKTSTSGHKFWKRFYSVIPMLLLCYFLPSLLNTFNIVDGEKSQLYYVASRFLLPSCLVLLTLSVDLKEIIKLGPKALIMFFTATVGVILGGPLAILIASAIDPSIIGGVGPEAVWRGMTTIAGSWIGGGANQAAMFEMFKPSNELYSVMITVDIVIAELTLALILIGIGKTKQIDKAFNADSSAIEGLKKKMEEYSLSIAKVTSLSDFMLILGLCFGATAFSHFLADIIAPWISLNAPYLDKYSLTSGFFWLVVFATAIGVTLSFTRFRDLEGAGASKIGSVFIYVLVATIGMKMDITAIMDHVGLFLVGGIWMAFHLLLLLLVGKLIKAPYFFLAVGSTANVGGAASAPVVAAAFHPSLAPVGVLLAVLGYVMGTYGAWFCGVIMETVSP